MTKIESILVEAQSLSSNERAQLVAKLEEQAARETEADEVRSGLRGLSALTESTAGEDWEPYYPPSLRTA